jgi:recombinational DNA repair ATPase RecF
MLKTLHLTNFTVFEDTKFEISPGLNVVIGDNGVGKTHLLKVAYTMMIGASSLGKTPHDESVVGVSSFVLSETFQTSALNELCRQGAPAAKIACHLEDSEEALQLDVDISQSPIYGKDLSNYADLEIIQQPKQANFSPSPIFIPVKETLSVFPGLISLPSSSLVMPVRQALLGESAKNQVNTSTGIKPACPM